MERELNVMVASVPTASRPAEKWRERQTFRIQGKAGRLKKGELEESFSHGLCGWVTKPVFRMLSEKGGFSDYGVKVKAVDAGEFALEEGAEEGLDEQPMLELAEAFSSKTKKSDFTLLFGGDHAGGLLLYALAGRVARFDQHSDACLKPLECGKGVVSRNDYVCTAIRNGLKKPQEIVGVGIRSGQAPYPVMPFAESCEIMDVDADVLAQRWGLRTDYDKGVLSPQDLVGSVRRTTPNAIGLFEITPNDPKALELALMLAHEGVKAAARRKTRE